MKLIKRGEVLRDDPPTRRMLMECGNPCPALYLACTCKKSN